MAKWFFTETNKAPFGEEILAVFEFSPGSVWHAIYDGKWTGTCLDSEGIMDMNGKCICWKPWPKSPFKEGADGRG